MIVAYLRVSTQRQGASGLGLEAQQEAIERYAATTGQSVLATFTEVESGAAKDRPQLSAALDLCRRRKATLLIARLDRLSRNLAFVAQLLDANVEIKAADMPEANRLMLQMVAVFAEHERRLISERTRAALAAAKNRGVRLGVNGQVLAALHRQAAQAYAWDMRDAVELCRADGATTCRAIAAALNERGFASREGGRWHASNVVRLLTRLERQRPA
jgi:DNA invertase Pin-like site-specific DNA recombinase